MANNLNSQIRAVNRKLKQSISPVKAGASSALNKVGSRIKSRVVKAVSGDVAVQQKIIRKRVYIRKSTTKSMKATVTAYRRAIPAISLGVAKSMVKNAKGQRLISATQRDSSGRFASRQFSGNTSIKVGKRTFHNAFVNRGKGGSWQIWQRRGSARYPIDVIKVEIAPSVDRHTPKISKDQMQTEYPRIVQHEIDFRMKKYAKR